MGPGIFGDMFDFNRDGKLDFIEQAAEFAFLDDLIELEKKDNEESEEENL